MRIRKTGFGPFSPRCCAGRFPPPTKREHSFAFPIILPCGMCCIPAKSKARTMLPSAPPAQRFASPAKSSANLRCFHKRLQSHRFVQTALLSPYQNGGASASFHQPCQLPIPYFRNAHRSLSRPLALSFLKFCPIKTGGGSLDDPPPCFLYLYFHPTLFYKRVSLSHFSNTSSCSGV